MNNPARVLLIGNQQNLLDVRASVLHHFWSVATTALALSETPAELADLAVLCHTLSDEDRQKWLERTRISHPNLLVVKLNGYDSGPHAGTDATVDAHSGPGALVSRIYELLTERGCISRGWPDVPEHVGAGVH